MMISANITNGRIPCHHKSLWTQ